MLPPSPPFPLLELLDAPPIPELDCAELELAPLPFSVPPEQADITNQLIDTAAKSAQRLPTIREEKAITNTLSTQAALNVQVQARDNAAYIAPRGGVYEETTRDVHPKCSSLCDSSNPSSFFICDFPWGRGYAILVRNHDTAHWFAHLGGIHACVYGGHAASCRAMSQARLAVVTGSNRGIGYEIARQLVTSGVRVIATARDATAGAKAAAEIGAQFESLNVADAASIDAFVQRLGASEGGLDIYVANAGIALDGFNADVARRTIDVNFYGAMRSTDKLLPLFRPDARVVMISSGMGELSGLGPAMRDQFAAPNLDRKKLVDLVERFVAEVGAGTHAKSGYPSSAYRVSKVALNAYVRILARELSSDPRNILVNAVCPGWVQTRMGGPSAPTSVAQGAETPVWLSLLPPGGPTGAFFRNKHAINF